MIFSQRWQLCKRVHKNVEPEVAFTSVDDFIFYWGIKCTSRNYGAACEELCLLWAWVEVPVLGVQCPKLPAACLSDSRCSINGGGILMCSWRLCGWRFHSRVKVTFVCVYVCVCVCAHARARNCSDNNFVEEQLFKKEGLNVLQRMWLGVVGGV